MILKVVHEQALLKQVFLTAEWLPWLQTTAGRWFHKVTRELTIYKSKSEHLASPAITEIHIIWQQLLKCNF